MRIDFIYTTGLATMIDSFRMAQGEPSSTTLSFSDCHYREFVTAHQSGRCVSVTIAKEDVEALSRAVLAGKGASATCGIIAYIKIEASAEWWEDFETTLGERFPSPQPKRIVPLSYRALRMLHLQRGESEHAEWREFCEFIETLPFAYELITIRKNEAV